MPTLAQIRAAMKSTVGGVADIGVVHDFERYTESESAFKTFFVSDGEVLGWIIRRVGRKVTSPGIGRYVMTNKWRITGYMSLDDDTATEKTFDDLLDAIAAAFLADDTLGGVVASVITPDNVAGAQLDQSGPVLLAGVLCHSARLTVFTVHYE